MLPRFPDKYGNLQGRVRQLAPLLGQRVANVQRFVEHGDLTRKYQVSDTEEASATYDHVCDHDAQVQVRGNLGQFVPSLGAGIKYQWFVDIEVQFTTSRMLQYHQSPDPVDLLAAFNSHEP